MAKKLITSPKGTARYPWLNTADTKFGDPTYKLEHIVEDGPEVEAFCAKIEDAFNEHFAEVEEAEEGNYDEIVESDLPFFAEDGEVIIRAKLNKNGYNKRTDESWENRIFFFDAMGKPIPQGQEPKVGGGSLLRFAAELNKWAIPDAEGRGKKKRKILRVGISLRLKSVQVIEARQGGNGVSAEESGFGAEEGFEYDPQDFDAGDDGQFDDDGDF